MVADPAGSAVPLAPAERVRVALEAGGIAGTLEWDIAGHRLAMDLACSHALGLAAWAHDGWVPEMELRRALHPQDWQVMQTLRGRTTVTAGRFGLAMRARKPDGTYRRFHANGLLQTNGVGHPSHFAGVLTPHDASDGTVWDGLLLTAVIEALPSLVYVKDRQGRLQVANSAVIDLVGKPWSEIENRTDLEVLDDKEEAARVFATDSHLMQTAGRQELEETVGRGEHGPRIFLSNKSALLDQDGTVIGLVGTSVDITARKMAERRSLESEARLRRVIDSMFAFVGIMDLDGVLLEANRAPVEGAGLAFEDVLGRPLWDAFWWQHDPAVRDQVKQATKAARAGETRRFDVEIQWRDQGRITIDFQIAPVRDDSGAIIQLIPSGVDITARREAEAQRQTLIMELHHRVQNLFLVASSMISMTARRVSTAQELADSVTGRLTALARAHALIRPAIVGDDSLRGLGDAARPGTTLNDLVAAIVAPHLTPDRTELRVAGAPLQLGTDGATGLALVLHELATNAAKYGALSVPDGALDIRWAETGGNLVLNWAETGGPPLDGAPARQGFGSQLVKSTITRQLRGDIMFDWAGAGLSVTLHAALDRLHAPDAANPVA